MPRLEFWFEFASTYSYPAAMRIESLAQAAGVAVDWKPFLLGPIFSEQGWSDSPFNIYPVKGRYMWRDLERTCDALSIPFVRPSRFPRNGVLASRVLVGLLQKRGAPNFRRPFSTPISPRIGTLPITKCCLHVLMNWGLMARAS